MSCNAPSRPSGIDPDLRFAGSEKSPPIAGDVCMSRVDYLASLAVVTAYKDRDGALSACLEAGR